VILDPGSPSSCVPIRVEPGFVPCSVLQVKDVGAVPRCAVGGGLELDHRVDTPHAERENAGMDACPASAPQRHAATRTRDPVAHVTPGRGAHKPSATSCSAAAGGARTFVERLEGRRSRRGTLNTKWAVGVIWAKSPAAF
jgi:hypothetical protein